MAPRTLVWLLASIAIAGCLNGTPELEQVPCTLADATATLRDVVVVGESQTQHWIGGDPYTPGKTLKIDAGPGAATTGRIALAPAGNRLIVVASDLSPIASTTATDITVMTWYDDILWVVDDWTLIGYDMWLTERARLDIEPPHDYGGGKVIDLAVGRGGRLFLVDDVVEPFFAFVVDVRIESDPRLEHTVEWGGQGPSFQWVNHKGDRWWIEDGWGGYGGGSSAVRSYALRDGEWQDAKRITYGHTTVQDFGDGKTTKTGFSIGSSTPVLPAWAIVSDEIPYVSQVDVVGDEVVASCATPVAGEGFPRWLDERDGTIAVGHSEDLVTVYRAGNPAQHVASFDVNQAIRGVYVV